jgi:hypothetical protein
VHVASVGNPETRVLGRLRGWKSLGAPHFGSADA